LGAVQDAEMIWGAMKKVQKIDGRDDLQCGAVTHPNSDL
jgi:hypothetical protein